jgi:hypothetical protein
MQERRKEIIPPGRKAERRNECKKEGRKEIKP